ncbi:MarR family winged helix-turn-helix transcriptional regulator [Paenibacillus sp. MBLB4367]|uniref:MarR family winged helix-turn-helix transcriptional regulator n=1 Tax=Paenibacillus sp. MBLB4367 TaxID=3384767 RepID=UPI0039081837
MTTDLTKVAVGQLFSLTYRKIGHVLTARFRPYEITTEQWSVLARLAEQEGISQKELAIRSLKDQPTITRILDCLDRKGLISKATNKEDRRSYLIHLTEPGKRVVEELLPLFHQALADVTQGISEERLELFRETLCAMIENADRHRSDQEK